MSPQAILYGHILSALATIAENLWIATQWVAVQFDYDPYLGPAWFSVFKTLVYYSWRLFEWWYAFQAYAPAIFRTGGKIVVGATFASIIIAALLSVWRGRRAKKLTTFGSSEWASKRIMERAGLLMRTGIFLGKFKNNYLHHAGLEHIMAFAPTRFGKGVGLVVPTLLS